MNLMQYGMSPYGPPPQFPRPTTPTGPSSHGGLSQVNISYFNSTNVGAMVAGPDAIFPASANSKKTSLLVKLRLCTVDQIDK
jgi:hypothetical protein